MKAPIDVPGLQIGDAAPEFDLPGVDNESHTFERYSDRDAVVVMFTCNHCPTVQDYEGRFVETQRDYADRGVQFIAINSNDSENYPEDDFDHMVTRAQEKGYNFPYLRDRSQDVAKAYGAVCTPEMFLFDGDRRLRYRGALDDNRQRPDQVQNRWLREALDAVLAGRDVADPWEPAFGCSIKWKY